MLSPASIKARSAVETARANLEQARAVAAFEEARLAKYALHAPYDAVVVSRNRELGAMLNPGEQLFTLVDPKTVWVLAYVDETKAGRLAVGGVVVATLPVGRIDQQAHRLAARLRHG